MGNEKGRARRPFRAAAARRYAAFTSIHAALWSRAKRSNGTGSRPISSRTEVVVRSAYPCWTRFLGLIPLAPNSLAVQTKDEREYRFVLFKRHAWRADIEARKVP